MAWLLLKPVMATDLNNQENTILLKRSAKIMNVYFISSHENSCQAECSFRSCPERFLNNLQEIPSLPLINRIPKTHLFQPTMSTPLRNGDLLIFHAESESDINHLIESRNIIEQLRLILIIGEEAFHDSWNYHQLNPRYTMNSQQNVTDLRDVVTKIFNHTHQETAESNTTNQVNL